MSTTLPDTEADGSSRAGATPGDRRPRGRLDGWGDRLGDRARRLRERVVDLLDRPLTSYYLILGATALLLTIGLVMVLSASSVWSYRWLDGDSYAVVKRQLLFVALGLPCAWIASRLPHQWIRQLAWPGFVVALGLLLLTSLYGVEINGNQNWLAVGPIRIQPSEIAKLALILWAAHVYAHKDRRLGRVHEVMMPVVPGMMLATVMVILGEDLGTAIVLFGILLAMLWVVGAPARFFMLCIGVIGVLGLALALISPHRVARITTFIDPFADYYGTGWQPAHGLYALASGGWTGEGLGASRQKWGELPEAHTDYVFAVLGEELGLIGTLMVLGLFAVLAFAALRVAQRTTDAFTRYMTFGIVAWLVGQMIINVGMVLTLLPVIGLPLPLISYGGSSMVPSLVALGIVVGFARREPAAARALAAQRRATRHARRRTPSSPSAH